MWMCKKSVVLNLDEPLASAKNCS